MVLGNWWAQRRARARRRLCLEPLEDRLALSGPGTLDPTFGTGGTVSVSLSASVPAELLNALVIQPDGKLVGAGSVSGGQGGEFAVARFNPDGSLDSGFGSGGSTFTSLASLPPGYFNGTGARGVALQPDGKIVLAGLYTVLGGLNHFGLVRCNADGSLDTSFGSGGIVHDPVDGDDFAAAVALQPDGKIVVVGAAAPGNSAVNFAVVRYNADGSRDNHFGTNGVVETPPPYPTDAVANAVLIQTDGKIVVGGHTSTSGGGFHYAVLRYNPNGSLDPTFGSGGEVFDNFGAGFGGEDVRALALQPDGKIVAAGVVYDYSRSAGDLALARYNADGSLDTSFDGTGRATLNVNGANNAAGAVAVQVNGKIVVAGGNGAPGGSYFLTARYHPDGTLDTSFGSGGSATQKFSQDGNDGVNAVALQADGKLVVAGTAAGGNSDSGFALARYFGDSTAFPQLTDSFDRADSPTLGPNWAQVTGSPAVKGKRLVAGGSVPALAVYKSSALAGTAVQVDVALAATGTQYAGLVARYGGSGLKNFYLGEVVARAGKYTAYLFRNQGGTYTQLASAPVSGGTGNLRLEVFFGSLKLLLNNQLLTYAYDSALVSGTTGAWASPGAALDNFAGGSLSAAAVPLPFSDAFTQADGGALSRSWTEQAGNFSAQGGRLRANDAGLNLATVNLAAAAADVAVQADIALGTSGTQFAGLVGRYAGPGDGGMYLGEVVGHNGQFTAYVFRHVGNTWTMLAAKALGSGTGLLLFTLKGSHLQLLFGGVVVCDVTDTAITAPGLAGLRAAAGALYGAFSVTGV